MTELRARSAVVHAPAPARRASARWWALGALVSLLLHGAAAAALFVPWGRGAEVDTAGGVVTVEIVAFSGPGAQPAGPEGSARPSFEAMARPHPERAATARQQRADARSSAHGPTEEAAPTPTEGSASPTAAQAVERELAEPPPPPPEDAAEAPAARLTEAPRQVESAPPPPARKPAQIRPARQASQTDARGGSDGEPPTRRMTQTASRPDAAEGALGGPAKRGAKSAGGGGGSGAAPLSGNPQPDYPLRARQRHWEGRVVLSVLVGEQGRPHSVSIKSSSGYDVLDAAAEDAIRRWRFEPARRGGRAVPQEIEIPVRFALKD